MRLAAPGSCMTSHTSAKATACTPRAARASNVRALSAALAALPPATATTPTAAMGGGMGAVRVAASLVATTTAGAAGAGLATATGAGTGSGSGVTACFTTTGAAATTSSSCCCWGAGAAGADSSKEGLNAGLVALVAGASASPKMLMEEPPPGARRTREVGRVMDMLVLLSVDMVALGGGLLAGWGGLCACVVLRGWWGRENEERKKQGHRTHTTGGIQKSRGSEKRRVGERVMRASPHHPMDASIVRSNVAVCGGWSKLRARCADSSVRFDRSSFSSERSVSLSETLAPSWVLRGAHCSSSEKPRRPRPTRPMTAVADGAAAPAQAATAQDLRCASLKAHRTA